jgi:hypothetical protein
MKLDFILKVILPILGAATAVFGLILALAKWRRDQTNARKAAAPCLEIFREESEFIAAEVLLRNQGGGTATLLSYELVVDGKNSYPCIYHREYDPRRDAYGLAFAQVGLAVKAALWYPDEEPPKVIGSAERISLLEIKPEDAPYSRNEIRAKLDRIKFRFKYQSKYGDEFEVCR